MVWSPCSFFSKPTRSVSLFSTIAVEILLGVEVDLLGVLLVFEPQFVECLGGAFLAGAGLDAALGLVGRQRVGGLVVGVVHAAGDDRPVRIAFEKVDDDLVADAGQLNTRPRRCRPRWTRRGSSRNCFRPSCPGGPSGTGLSPGRARRYRSRRPSCRRRSRFEVLGQTASASAVASGRACCWESPSDASESRCRRHPGRCPQTRAK